jgi:hypothetical protein
MNTREPKKIGTRHEFRTWLSSMKNMNYTFYSKLSIERKEEIQQEYHKRQNSCRSTVYVTETRTPAEVEVSA